MNDFQDPNSAPTIGAIFAPEFAAAATRAGARVITGADFREAAAAIVQHSTQIGSMFPIVVGDVADLSLETWVSAVAQSAPGTVGFLRNPGAPAAFLSGLPAGVNTVDFASTVNAAFVAIGAPALPGGEIFIIEREVPAPAPAVFPDLAPAVADTNWDTPVGGGPVEADPASEVTPVEEPVQEEEIAYIPEPDVSLADLAHQAQQQQQQQQQQQANVPAAAPAPAAEQVPSFDSWDNPVGAIPVPETPPAPVQQQQRETPPVAANQAPQVQQPAPAVPGWETPSVQQASDIQAPQLPAVAPQQHAWDMPAEVQPQPVQPDFQAPPFPQPTQQAPVQQGEPWATPPAQPQPAQPFPQLFGAPVTPAPDAAPAPDMNAKPVEQTGMGVPNPAQEFSFNPAAFHEPVPAPAPAPASQNGAVADDPWNTPVDGSTPSAQFGVPAAAPRVDNTYIQTIAPTVHSEVQVAGLFDGYKPAAWKGQVITSFSGKGGVGKTTCSLQLARVASEAGLRTILIDGNVGQGDVLQYLRLNTADMPTIYDVALRIQSGNPHDVMRNGVIQPEAANAARRAKNEGLDDLQFAIIAAAPSGVEDHRLVTNQLYNAVIDFAASNADIVILDTQIIEAGDRSNFVGEVVLPLLRHGAYGLGISESGVAGANNLLDRLTRLNNDGIDHRQLMSMFNKVKPAGIAAAEGSAQYFSSLASYVGHVPQNDEIEDAMNRGMAHMDDPALNATLNRVLFNVTGDRRFEEASLSHAANGGGATKSASKFSLFKKKGNR